MSVGEHEVEQRPFRKRRVLAVDVVVALLLGAGCFWFLVSLVQRAKGIPDVDGSVLIQAEPGMRVFVGDRLMGTGEVRLKWPELLSEEAGVSPATELPLTADLLTPETLGEPGSSGIINPFCSSKTVKVPLGGGDLSASSEEWLLRRPDGMLDQVYAIVLDWNPPFEEHRRLLVPVRVRRPAAEPPAFIFGLGGGIGYSSHGGFLSKLFGKAPTEWTMSLDFHAGNLPRGLVEDYKRKGILEHYKGKGIWEPGR